MDITNKSARLLVINGTRLMPGKNKFPDLSEKDAKAILANEQFKSWCQLGWVSHSPLAASVPKAPEDVEEPEAPQGAEAPEEPEAPQGAEAPEEPEASEAVEETPALKDMTIKEAKAFVEKCLDADFLLAAYESEAREKVKEAIEARLEILDQ